MCVNLLMFILSARMTHPKWQTMRAQLYQGRLGGHHFSRVPAPPPDMLALPLVLPWSAPSSHTWLTAITSKLPALPSSPLPFPRHPGSCRVRHHDAHIPGV